MFKIAYDIVKYLPFFSWPMLRSVRNAIYNRYLHTTGIAVDQDVRINQLHRNSSSKCRIGCGLHAGAGVLIDLSGSVDVGDRVTVSEGAKIYTHRHPIDGPSVTWREDDVEFSVLKIEDDVWIGANAVILSSVKRLGRGAVVAAGAVVTSDVPDLGIAVGVPARLVRKRRIGTVRG